MGTAAIRFDATVAGGKKWLAQLLAGLRRRLSERAAERPLRVEQSAMLGNKATVSLVSIDGERLLVGVTGGCIRFQALRGTSLEFPIGGSVK